MKILSTNGEISARAREERLRLIRSDLLRRMKPICPNMPDDLFLEMVDGMATVQLKYELIGQPS